MNKREIGLYILNSRRRTLNKGKRNKHRVEERGQSALFMSTAPKRGESLVKEWLFYDIYVQYDRKTGYMSS